MYMVTGILKLMASILIMMNICHKMKQAKKADEKLISFTGGVFWLITEVLLLIILLYRD